MTRSGSHRKAPSTWLCAAGIVVLLAQAVPAQEPQSEPDQSATQTQPRAEPPTLLHALARWFDESLSSLNYVPGPFGDVGARSGETVVDATTSKLVVMRVARTIPGRTRMGLLLPE